MPSQILLEDGDEVIPVCFNCYYNPVYDGEIEEKTEFLNSDSIKYQELLMAVENKFPGESRHETALKYIRAAQNQGGQGQIES